MYKNNNLSSVQNALRILNSFSIEDTQKGITQISKELDIGKSTVSRLLNTMLNEGYIKKDNKSKRYSLGNKILTLYSSFMSNMEIVKEARPFLEELAKQTNESVQLAELEALNVIYVDQIKSTYPIQIFAHVGRINPIHCTSSGKLLLSYEDEIKIDEILKTNFVKHTSYTKTNAKILKEELIQIKKDGYCLIENEFIEGIVSIAAPIKDYNNKVIAAVSIVGPIQRMNGPKLQSYINKIMSTSENISKSIGFNYN